METDGVLIVVSGPSGVGKTSLCEELLEANETLEVSTSYTTRPRRETERDGEDYFFVERERFDRMRENGDFVEWAEVHGHLYGTSRDVLEGLWSRGSDVLFDIDIQGAKQIKEQYPSARLVLVRPPDLETLEERLRRRGTESEDVIRRRMAAAVEELGEYPEFDYSIENREFDSALADLQSIYSAATLEIGRQSGEFERLLRNSRKAAPS